MGFANFFIVAAVALAVVVASGYSTATKRARDPWKAPNRGLLDTRTFPNGPQLCYLLGTDARIAMQQ